MRIRITLGVALTVALLTAMSVGTVLAQELELGNPVRYLSPSNDSGVEGEAKLIDTDGGVQVELQIRGATAGEHPAHIHAGATCADDRAGQGAPVEFPLNNVVVDSDGSGSSKTVVPEITPEELFSGDPVRYINVHTLPEGQEAPPGIACANLGATTIPDTGGIQPLVFLLYGGIALVSLGAMAGFLTLRSR